MKVNGKCIDCISNELYELEIYECSCGFHIGLDATYLDQCGPIKTPCPSCGALLNTKLIDNALS